MIVTLIVIILLLVAALIVQGIRHREIEKDSYDLGRERERNYQERRFLNALYKSEKN